MQNNKLSRFRSSGIMVMFLAAALSACAEENAAPIASPELMETGADHVIIGMTHMLSVNGIREARVEADTAFYFADSTVYSLRNSTMILFNEFGAERARVVSLRGRLNLNTKELVARGNVILTIPEGDRKVETEELNYDPNGDRIWSDSATVMYEGTMVTRGQSFESDLQFQRAVVLNGSITQGGGAPPADPPAGVPAELPANRPDTLSDNRPSPRPEGGLPGR